MEVCLLRGADILVSAPHFRSQALLSLHAQRSFLFARLGRPLLVLRLLRLRKDFEELEFLLEVLEVSDDRCEARSTFDMLCLLQLFRNLLS